MTDQSDPVSFGIADVLDTLWSDLNAAEMSVRSGKRNKMVISGATVEIAFTLTSQTDKSRKLAIQVLGVGGGLAGGARSGTERIHRVTIHLAPKSKAESIFVKGENSDDLYDRLSDHGKSHVGRGTAKRAPAKRTAKRTPSRKASARRAFKR